MTDLFTLLTLAASLAAVVLLVLLLKRSGSNEAELARIEGLERVVKRKLMSVEVLPMAEREALPGEEIS